MKRPKQLSAAFVKTVKEPGRYGDGRGGHGLSMLVKESTTGRLSKSWSQRLRINGQPFNIGLGGYPVITLAKAREVALENRRAVADGIDLRIPPRAIPTFSDAIESVIAIRSESWKNAKTEKKWRSGLGTYAVPMLGHKLVSEVSSADVMAVLTPIWVEKPEIGKQVREQISSIMEWGIVEGHRTDNPASKAILKTLPKRRRTNHLRALPFAEVGAAIEQVKTTGAHWSTKAAFEFLVLTACRSGEVRLSTWDEIDLNAATWTIPAERMKNGLHHKVPLTGSALDVLYKAKDLDVGTRVVFPSVRGKAMSDNTISKLLRDNGIGTTVHGVRSSFRDWAAECTSVPREISEHALAHVEGSESELAYRRTDYFEKRRGLMEAWADYLVVH